MNKTFKIVFLAIMLSFSLILYYVESMLPPLNILAPGSKLGLSNILSLTCLFILGFKDSVTILFMRIFLSSTFYGGMSTFLYSITGGVLSILSMALIKSMNFKSVSPIGISIVGSFFFNVGQLIVSAIVLSNIKIFYYLPYMSLFSILTGLLTGLSSLFLIRHINKIIRFEQK